MSNQEERETLVYEDALIYAYMPKDGSCIGHTIVKTKSKKKFLDCTPDEVIQIFTCASITSSMVYEGLQSQGTNIILQDGKAANAQSDEVILHILPRKENDGLNFLWTPQEMSPEQLAPIAEKLSANNFIIGNSQMQVENDKNDNVPPPMEPQTDDELFDTVYTQLTRFP